ncbi:MAG: histone deacetylase [Candidatus Eisenbacteria bacterium]|uniref:Histone deacetylase n=1 Tax=Eiseniibacteriota bacterium TaxID=2212470 RepID=A0A849SLK8_UNCEI|nr:histone deacetylase [Candidatus Eisenbacteria bacterium]
MRPLHAWTNHEFQIPLPAGHRFPSAKYAPLVERVLSEGLVERDQLHPAREAPVAWLERTHAAEYVARAIGGTPTMDDARRLGLPWSRALVARARASVYGTVAASFAALTHGVSGNLAGGSHHAHRDRAGAYCLFNDIAVAIEVLRARGFARRPFVVDLDVHQGDGTATCFAGDPSVFTFSMHAGANYPARKAQSSLDVELDSGCDDSTYLAALETHLPAALEHHRPDLVWYQAGVDPLDEDRLGKLAITADGLARRDSHVFEWCERVGAPVVVTLGGGYSDPHDASVEAHLGVWRAARHARERRASVNDPRPFDHGVDEALAAD